ncbi:hypothetical protein Sros01_71840 [Streptomyces roseochromogenus]|nr:hypothetical protein Sros01_71840 [Streptomyces roseochromogenus]
MAVGGELNLGAQSAAGASQGPSGLAAVLRREGADAVRKGRLWNLPLEDRVLLLAAYVVGRISSW